MSDTRYNPKMLSAKEKLLERFRARAQEQYERDEPGFWEVRGYHNYGDPWRQQRYGGRE